LELVPLDRSIGKVDAVVGAVVAAHVKGGNARTCNWHARKGTADGIAADERAVRGEQRAIVITVASDLDGTERNRPQIAIRRPGLHLESKFSHDIAARCP